MAKQLTAEAAYEKMRQSISELPAWNALTPVLQGVLNAVYTTGNSDGIECAKKVALDAINESTFLNSQPGTR